ncbi:MAG TPA: hypothetical protein VH020_07245 [Stellaceae bacterium]|jgi:hypothetical protein|nr:hypothetical protein [Stellaceae bacterium]
MPRLAPPPEFVALLAVAFGLRLGAVYLAPNIHWPDEIFQGMEPAHRLVFGTGAVAWEWLVGARSWLLPGLIAALMEVGRLFGDAPAIVNLPVVICLAAAGCVPAACAYGWARRFGGRAGGFVAASVPAVWVDLVYMSCHSLAEVMAADCLPAALYLGLRRGGEPVSRRRLWAAGALLGLTFAFRFHLAPALTLAAFGMGGWRNGWAPWRALLAGACAPVLALGLLDWATLGAPFQSIAFNLWFNLEEGADYAGRSPAATLIVLPLYLWGAGFAAMIFTAILGARRLPAVGGVIVVIFAIYSAIAHKEYRFIYPALVLIAILAGIGSAELLRYWRQSPRRLFATARVPAALAALAWLAVSAALAHSAVYRQPWTRARAQIAAFDFVDRRPDLCGLGLYGVRWLVTPGDSGLPPGVGLDQTSAPHLEHDLPAFNYILARAQAPVPDARYRRQACFRGDQVAAARWAIHLCVWRRDGGCDAAAAPGVPVNWPDTVTGKPEADPPPGWQDP